VLHHADRDPKLVVFVCSTLSEAMTRKARLSRAKPQVLSMSMPLVPRSSMYAYILGFVPPLSWWLLCSESAPPNIDLNFDYAPGDSLGMLEVPIGHCAWHALMLEHLR
jgi:hypothetical protein